ncbi:MAG TPA: SpoIIE family protein phosphatase [Acidobacteriaceae bacterium]|nr:SpoIIE family protein phosphatase [Acidobacteriaceae bacterium]
MTIERTRSVSSVTLQVRDGDLCRAVRLDPLPFLIGRDPESQLVFTQTFISRRHAEIVWENGSFVIRDLGSRHGIYVDGKPVTEHTLRTGDRIRLGSVSGPELQFGSDRGATRFGGSSSDLLEKLHELPSNKSELQKLNWFLAAARELSSAGAVDRVMASLLDATIRLAQVERGFVFLMDAGGSLELAAGMDAEGGELGDSSTISQTVIQKAIAGKEQFLITDTLTAEGVAVPESIVAQQIRTVICIPLRQLRGRDRRDESPPLVGLLYLDSHFEPAQFTNTDHELLRTIAREASALVENAQLALVEESARKQAEELQFAAQIQQALMATQIPQPEFARVQAHSIACSAVGGDFYDVLLNRDTRDTLSVALVDVSGKGASAAILASILQGMLYVQMEAGRPLAEIAASMNEYLCRKAVGKYATMVLASLRRDGHLEYINCGHVRPRVAVGGDVFTLEQANFPVGLIAGAGFESAAVQLQPGARLLLVSDGVTEAENPDGEFFGDEGLEQASRCAELAAILELLRDFSKGTPASDDCTLVQLQLLA